MSSPPTSKLARGAVSGLALAQAGVARMGHQARNMTRKPSEQDAARVAYEADLGRILFRALNQLKGTALKLSQLLASHADFLPEGVRAELAKSCYQVTPLNRALVLRVFRAEFSAGPEALFAQFDSQAFAAASLGQVHRATLHDGTAVAVKVQYPGIASSIASDLKMVRTMLRTLGGDMLPRQELVDQVMDDVAEKLTEELDYTHEAAQMAWFADSVRLPGIAIPRSFAAHSTARILTMERLEGLHLDAWLATNPAQAERDRFGQLLFDWFLHCTFELGRVNADPHPGNFMFLPDGRLGVLDFGCTRALSPTFRDSLARSWNAMLNPPASGSNVALRLAYVDLQVISPTLSQHDFDTVLIPALGDILAWYVEPFRAGRCDFAQRLPAPKADARHARMLVSSTHGLHQDLPYFDRAYTGVMQLLKTLGADVATANCWIKEKRPIP